MQEFVIYHPIQGMNHFCLDDMRYHKVATIHADSLEDAFTKGQNDFSEEYHQFEVRSTSVGDVILTPDGKAMMVHGVGWEEVGIAISDDGNLYVPPQEDAASIADRQMEMNNGE